MEQEQGMKEWVRASRPANGRTSVTVTLQEGNLTAKWTALTDSSRIKEAVTEARRFANVMLDELREATSD
jgi:hypothetical protein